MGESFQRGLQTENEITKYAEYLFALALKKCGDVNDAEDLTRETLLATFQYKSIEHDVKKWLSQKNTSEKKVKALSDKLKQRKSDQEQILLERIRDREHADIYTGMLTKCEKDIANITAELAAIQDYDVTIRKRKAEMKSSIDILGEIVKEGAISDSNMRLLIDDIVISECGGKLSINIHLKAAFRSHLDIYDKNGQLTDQAFAVS